MIIAPLLAAALLADKPTDVGLVCFCVAIGLMIVVSIIFAFLDKPIRCARCGFRAKKSRFQGGRCPKCDSYEL